MYEKIEYPQYFVYLLPIISSRIVSLHQQSFCQCMILFFLMIFNTLSLDQFLNMLTFFKSNVTKFVAYVNWIDTPKYKEMSSRCDKGVLIHEDTRVYCFSLYHHQQWRFPSGWCDVVSSGDPPVWSDVYLKQTPSPDKLHLPPSIQTYDENKLCYVYWKRIDPTWLITEQAQCTDGWFYGDTRWKHWTPFGLNSCTRRQLRIRRAKRIEIRIDV